MAGIGFELRRLFRSRSVFGGLRAAVFAALITVGPTMLCMLMITALQQLLKTSGFALADRHLFMGAILYSFMFSLIFTSGLTMTLSRYVSDRIYLKEYGDILPSLTGALTLCLVLGGAIGIAFYYGKPIGLLFKISAYLLFVELCILWVQMVYVSALRDHSRLLRGFLLGVIVGVISAQAFALRTREVATMLLSVDIGFLLVIGFFGVTIREHFPTNGRDYYGFLEYFRRYPSLFLCGLMQALGLYVHSLVVWCGKHQLVVENTFVMAPTFDVPVFWAFLSILPALVTFVVFSETSFFEKYAAFYHAINSGGTWEAIKGHKQEMLAVLRKNLRLLVGSQMTIALLCLALGLAILPKIGFGASSLSIFGTMVIGDFAFIIMYICSTILHYFDDRKGALFAAFVFATANGLFTGLVTSMGEHYYGIGFAGAAFLGLLVVLLRLKAVTTDLDYFTFCAQPVSRPQAK